MRLPVNLLLYVVATGLLGSAGYTFYQSLRESRPEVRKKAAEIGMEEARDLIAGGGKGQGQARAGGVLYDTAAWRGRFLAPNLTGKEPPKAGSEAGPEVPVVQARVDQRPLDEVIELVSLVCDTSTKGEGGESLVIVRYKPTADVQPPRWYQLANQQVAASPQAPAAAADVVAGRGRPSRPNPQPRPGGAAMPTSSAGQEILQVLRVTGDGSPKHEAMLWPPFDDVRLVRVMPDARSAWFRRNGPPTADGKAGAPIEEEVFRSSMDLPADVKKTIADVLRTDARRVGAASPSTTAPVTSGSWQEYEETKLVGSTVHISRKDQAMMQSNADALLDRVNVEPWSSRTGSGARGLRFVNVAPDVANRFGVQQGDLLISVNGESVSTRAEAITVGKRLYNRGVRSFTARFLSSDGRQFDRVYQAPDR